MSFRRLTDQFNWYEVRSRIESQTGDDVRRALRKTGPRDWYDFIALVSPAAHPFLEELLSLSRALTESHFGKRMRLYVPLYLSNYCHNSCVYCGYRIGNTMPRTLLSPREIKDEVEAVKAHGFDHVLLVTGDYPKLAGVDYLEAAVALVRPYFSTISIEVQPLSEAEYVRLVKAGVSGVFVYQETYNTGRYRDYHPKGMKSHFHHRLETAERVAAAGASRVGLGVLLGLEDWRTDSAFVALHARFLLETFPGLSCSVSFPRLRPAEGSMEPNVTLTDDEMLQLIGAYRLTHPSLDMAMSTRESGAFRDRAVPYGVTLMSAGSRTNPGGYATHRDTLEQFEISDDRTPEEVADMLTALGYDAVWHERANLSQTPLTQSN